MCIDAPLLFNLVFGWGENMDDGKYEKENKMENTVFHCLVEERK